MPNDDKKREIDRKYKRLYREKNSEYTRGMSNQNYYTHWEERQNYFRKYRETHRDERNARKAVARAVKSGKLIVPQMCEECQVQEVKLQAHHYLGYAKEHQLDVKWLCPRCHGRVKDKEV